METSQDFENNLREISTSEVFKGYQIARAREASHICRSWKIQEC